MIINDAGKNRRQRPTHHTHSLKHALTQRCLRSRGLHTGLLERVIGKWRSADGIRRSDTQLERRKTRQWRDAELR